LKKNIQLTNEINAILTQMFFRGNEISITAKNKLVVPKFLRKNFMEEKLLIFVICLLACRKDTGL
jgi:hypothetical protein